MVTTKIMLFECNGGALRCISPPQLLPVEHTHALSLMHEPACERDRVVFCINGLLGDCRLVGK